MKKILALVGVFLLGLSANAVDVPMDFSDMIINEGPVTMENIWKKLGKREEKINLVGSKILNANKIPNRVNFVLARGNYTLNAATYYSTKTVKIYTGLFNYIDNDDELAAILSHEIAHDMDFYDGFGKLIVMKFNSKAYEYKADEIGIDYMVKAGYNPLAMITIMNKIGGESIFDWGTFTSHPKTSSRLMKDYEYIYKKYPSYLTSPMAKNIYYVNWTHTAQKDIQKFQQREKERASKRGSI